MKKKLTKLDSKLLGAHNTYKQLEKDNHQCLSLIRSSALPIFFLSPKGLITYANQSFLKMVGYSHPEISAISIFTIIESEIGGSKPNILFTNILKKQHVDEKALEIQFRKKTGEVGWVAIESFTYKRETVNHERFIQCVLRDITREKELQAEIDILHKTNKDQALMLLNLIENTEAHIVVRNVDDTITWANTRFLETFGFSLEEIVGKTELNLWPVEVVKKIKAAGRVVIRNKERNTIELSIDNKGKQFAVLMTIFPMFNSSGEVEFTGVLAVDVTQIKRVEAEREKAEAEAKNNRKLLDNFIDNASTPIYAMDLNDRIIIANKAFANRYGLAKEELFGKSTEEFETLTSIKVNEAIPEANRQVIDKQKPVHFECSMFQPILNKTTHFNYTVFPLFSDDGMLSGVGTIMTDRTQTIKHTIELENTRYNADMYKLKAEYNEYLLQSYMDNVPYYASIINLEGNFEFINKYALNLWGETKENITNKHFTSVIKNEHFLGHIAQGLEFVLNENRAVEHEEVLILPDTDDVTFLTNMFPLFNATGTLFAVGIFRVDITKRKQVEQERERWMLETLQAQDFLSSLIDHIPIPVFYKNANCIYTGVNRAFCKLWGKTKEEFIGKTVFDLNIDRALADKWHEKDTDLLHNQTEQVYEYLSPSADGSIRDVIYRKNVFYTPDGKLGGIIGVIQDITESRLLENRLEESRQMLQEVINHIPQAIFWKDLDLVYLGGNQLAARDTGCASPEDIVGKTDYDMAWREHAEHYRADDRQVIDSGIPKLNYEEPMTSPSGDRKWLRTNKIPFRNADGQIVGVLGSYEDITVEKLLKESLRLNEERYRSLYNNTPVMLYSIDEQGKIIRVSDYWCGVMGYTREEVLGRKSVEFLTEASHRYATEEILPLFFKTGSCQNVEYQYVKKDGTVMDCLMSAVLENDADGQTAYSLAVLTDITKRKQMEKTLWDKDQLLHSVLDNIPQSVFWKDTNMVFMGCNLAFAAEAGVNSPADLVGKTDYDMPWAAQAELYRADDRQVMDSGISKLSYEEPLTTSDGDSIWLNTNKVPLRDDTGQIYAVLGTFEDVTERKTRELQLDEIRRQLLVSNRVFHGFMNNVPFMIQIYDMEERLLEANELTARSIDRTIEEVIGTKFIDLMPDPELARQARESNAIVFESRKPYVSREVQRMTSGEIVWVMVTKFPIFDSNGEMVNLGVTVIDVSEQELMAQERDRLLKEMNKQQLLLTSIIDNAPDFISIKDKEHRYVMANNAFANLMHLTPADFVNKDDIELGFPEELVKGNPEKGITGFWAENQKVIDSGQIQCLPFEPVVVDGVMHTFKTTKTPLKNADGQVWSVLTFALDITVELRQQEILRQNEERFRLLYNSTPAMLYSIDKEGEITTVSDYWLEVMGYAREEVLGRKLADFVTTDSLQYSREVVWPIFMKNGVCFNEEFRFIKKDGGIITCLLSAVAQLDADGQLVGSLEVLVDITELRNKELEIANSKRLLTDLIDNIPYQIALLDKEERIVIINHAFANTFNFTPQQLIGKYYLDYVDAQLYEIAKNTNEYVLHAVQQITMQEQTISPSGDTVYLLTVKFPVYNSVGEFSYIGIVDADITETVVRENELMEARIEAENSKALMKSFLDNAAMAMFAKDVNGNYIIKNKKKEECELLRKLERSNLGLNLYESTTPEVSRIDDAHVITQNTAMTFYDRLLSNDDSELYTETVKFPIYDKNNVLIGVGGITKDITEIVERERELEDAKQKAEDAASSQERFLASMSHDMRTPLNGVVGMINLLEQTSLTPEQEEYMEAMKVSSYNLRILINDILDVSKIQAGKLNIECVLFDLNEILASVNNVFIHEASRKGVVFSIELPPDIPVMLEGDPSRLNQILNNLIGNALKFTSEGFVKLKLLYENLTDNNVDIEFVVEDSGIGISEEGLDKLFQPFVQASSDTTRKFGGSGLGLSICKSLVELQQGEIGVSSTLGKGSIFRFNIPYIKAKQVKKIKQKNKVTEPVSVQPLPPMRCLVFEDNLINQKVAFHTLKKMGVAADMAGNGKIGVDILKKNAVLYDFILMDIQMPEMDGYEATTVIRNELGLRIPIIAMTASALKGEKERCLEVGMTDFVPKPFVIDELLYVVRKLIKKDQEEELDSQPANEVTDDTVKAEAIKQQSEFGDEPLYDMTNVLEMEDDDFTLDILNTFLDTIPEGLQNLKKEVEMANDWDTVTKVAHKLKGGVGVLQMTEMIKQLQTIELNAKKREDLQVIPEAIDICFKIYEAVKDEIVKLRDEAERNG